MSTPQKSREIRLGIVMYGGVSLAIYINGVSQELFRAVQGEGIYRLLKLCFDTDIIVDIVSGTSAGGINGLLLAYALANGSDFSRTKDLWRDNGDIAKLMYEANADPAECKSLLDSDNFYRDRLAKAFEDLDENPSSSKDCEPSLFPEMDVFITGTTFQPQLYTAFDDNGRAIDMQDFRKVFKLKYRWGRENPGAFSPAPADKPARFQAMAKLARVTSSFPGAFLPVCVLRPDDRKNAKPSNNPSEVFLYEPEVDELLCEWGKLEHSSYFLDGGVLNNKPFTPTIEAIFGRTADRPVSRVLFYVEPDPETLKSGSHLIEPNFVSAVRNGVISISTYQSTTDDAKTLEDHNSQVVRHVAVCCELEDKLGPGDPSTGVKVPPSLADPHKTLYISARNNQLASRALRGILRDGKTGSEPHMTSASERAQVKQWFHSLNTPRKQSELSYDQTFERYDIYFRQRRVHHTVKWLYRTMATYTQTQDAVRSARWLLEGLNRHIQLLEILEHWFEDALGRVPPAWDAPDELANLCERSQASAEAQAHIWDPLWTKVSISLRNILRFPSADASWLPRSQPTSSDWLNIGELDRVNDELKVRAQAPLPEAATVVLSGAFQGLLQWTDELEKRLLAARNDGSEIVVRALREYSFFASLDAVIFPLDYLSNLNSFNEVRLLRISPAPTLNENQQGCIGFKADLGVEGKLAGRLLGHFSGFLKRSWRSNDILWGRLDGVRHIVLAVVTSDRICELRKDTALCRSIWQRLEASGGLLDLVQRTFPQSPAESHKQVAEFFSGMLKSPDFVMNAKNLLEMQNLLVELAQLECIADELPTVLQDAAVQQAEWNRYGKNVERPAEGQTATNGAATQSTWTKAAHIFRNLVKTSRNPTFIAPAGFIDPALIGLHVENEIQQFTDSWQPGIAQAKTPKETRLGRYFEEKYDVAQEGLDRGVPPLVLAEYMMRVSLVLNACVLGSLPKATREKITSTFIYKRALRMPLRMSHGVVRLWMREPKLTAITLTSMLSASLVAIVLGLYLVIGHPSQPTEVEIFLFLLFLFGVSSVVISLKRKLGL